MLILYILHVNKKYLKINYEINKYYPITTLKSTSHQFKSLKFHYFNIEYNSTIF